MKENFCNMCCDHHVGRRYLNKVADCKSKCSGLLKGINWRYITKSTSKTENSSTSKPSSSSKAGSKPNKKNKKYRKRKNKTKIKQ